MEKNKIILDSYFKYFGVINCMVLIAILLLSFAIPQSQFVLFLYLLSMFGWAIYARINFELRRVYAGFGSTLIIIFLSRIVLLPGFRNRTGVLAKLDKQLLDNYYAFLTSNSIIEVFNIILLIGTFFMIFDIYHGVKHPQSKVV